MSKLDALLLGDQPPGVYRFRSRASVAGLERAVTAHGWKFAYLDGTQIHDKASFLRACAESMQLPGYFGRNWDALYDCLTDIEEPGHVILYDAVAHLARNDPEVWATAYEVLTDAVVTLQEHSTKLYVLLRGTAGAVPDAPLV